jgi:cation/acetate symporter
MGTDGSALIAGEPIFPLRNPGIISVPLGFAAAILATLLSRERHAEDKFAEFAVRANTGLGAEKATHG